MVDNLRSVAARVGQVAVLDQEQVPQVQRDLGNEVACKENSCEDVLPEYDQLLGTR